MSGFLGFAPIYANGLLAIFCVFVLPGLVLVRALPVTGFAQRWFVVFLGSVSFNHLFVVLIASLHLDPLGSYRAAVSALVAALIFSRSGTGARRTQISRPGLRHSLASRSDADCSRRWFSASPI